MAGLPKFTDKDFNNDGQKVDFDLGRVFNMPIIEVRSR